MDKDKLQALQAAILADPALKKLASDGADNAVAAALNAPSGQAISVNRQEFLAGILTGLLANKDADIAIRWLGAISVLAALGGDVPAEALTQAVGDSLLTQQQADAMSTRKATVAETLGLPTKVSDLDVSDSLAALRPDGKVVDLSGVAVIVPAVLVKP